MKTTNYYNTFIEVADDCPAKVAEVPPQKGKEKTVANIQYEMLTGNPYKHTSDDVLRVFKTLCQPSSQINMSVQPALKMYSQLRQGQVPVLHRMCPAFGGLEYTGIEQL